MIRATRVCNKFGLRVWLDSPTSQHRQLDLVYMSRWDNRQRSQLRKYRSVRPDIGEGTYSQVGLYKRVVRGIGGSNLLFAVKVIHRAELSRYNCPVYKGDGVVSVESVRFQIDRELSFLRTLDKCSHIVRLEEVIETNDCMYIVYRYGGLRCMEFDDTRGGYSATVSSDERHEFPWVLEPADACECMRQLLSAVQALHAVGISHKDIKPDNVLVNYPFQRWRELAMEGSRSMVGYQHDRPIHITLIDFNSAEAVDADGKIYDAQGTVLFTPPEAFLHSQYDGIDGFARDMWSVGVLGYTMLTGGLPVTGERSLEIQLKLIGLSEPIEVPVAGDDSLKFLIESLLSIDPTKRPSALEGLQILGVD